jgi:hypothetical protein
MQAVAYSVGDAFNFHKDTNGGDGTEGRAVTVILYLSEDFDGGETVFPLAGRSDAREWVLSNGTWSDGAYHGPGGSTLGACTTERGLVVEPKAGSALIFYNHAPNSGTSEPTSMHGGCAVRRRERVERVGLEASTVGVRGEAQAAAGDEDGDGDDQHIDSDGARALNAGAGPHESSSEDELSANTPGIKWVVNLWFHLREAERVRVLEGTAPHRSVPPSTHRQLATWRRPGGRRGPPW